MSELIKKAQGVDETYSRPPKNLPTAKSVGEDQYVARLEWARSLTPEMSQSEVECFQRDMADFVAKLTPYISTIASSLFKPNTCLSLDDLVAEGQVGLLHAIRNYSPQSGVGFRQYARHRIRGQIIDSIRDRGSMIRISVSQRKILSQARKLQELGDDTSRIQSSLGVTTQTLTQATISEQMANVLSKEQTEANLGHSIDPVSNDDDLDRLIDRHFVSNALSHLTPRQIWIVERIYGLNGQAVQDLGKIGQALGVSKSRVSQLHTQALAQLRQHVLQ